MPSIHLSHPPALGKKFGTNLLNQSTRNNQLSKSWQAMGFLEQSDAELSAAVNKHWREVAEYDRYVTPLLVRLESVEWHTVLALHSARWHRGAVEAIRARTPRFHYCSSALAHQELIKESQNRKPSGYGWLGSYYNTHTSKYRRIQRYPLLYVHDTGTYPVQFCPPEGQPVSWEFWFRTSDIKNPIWTPEAHAWQSYKKAKELYTRVLYDIDTEKRSSPHRRQYLADCLRSSSQRLGSYSTQNYTGAGGFFKKETYELDVNLNRAIGGNSKPSYLGALSSDELGEIEAKWEHFQRCLKAFHQEEKPKQAVNPEKSTPQLSKPSEPAADSQLVRDTYLHFLGVFEPFADLDEREGLRQWAIHLADLWASPRQHSAPSNYDAAYYNQSGDTRAEFLAALRRIQAAVWLALWAPGAEKELFEGRGLLPDGKSEELRGKALVTLATRGTAWLLDWLSWREQHPTRQLFTALYNIELANANLTLTSQEAERPPCLFIPDSSPAVEAVRFIKLLAEFRQHLPSKRAKLRALLAELEPLRVLPLDLLTTGPASELARFSMISWAGRKEYPADCTLAETFWSDLEQALRTRTEWAAQAYDVVAVALGEAPKSKINSSTLQPLNTPVEDSCYCRTHPNVETLADLPASCRIHEVIRGALPEIERQIAARKLADTPADFRAYCEGELAHHVKNVGDIAKNLAHPTLYSEAERPQMLELKLWNLTLCDLYKSELSTLAIISPTPAPQRLKAPAPTVTALSEADRILGASFTLEDADQLARAVGIINEAGIYVLGPRKLGAVVGFCLALQQAKKLVGAIPSLTAVLAPRWSTQVITRKTGTDVAEKYFKLTNKALARPKETD
jgi:hypothetical protein